MIVSKKHLKILLLIICTAYAVINSGCFSFRDIGDDLGEGLMGELKKNADTIGFELVKGMQESLTSDKSKHELALLIDSLITRLGYNTNRQLTGIRDSLLNEYINKWIQGVVEDAIGNTTRQKLGLLRDEVIGDKTARLLLNIRNSFFDYYLKQYVSDILNSAGPNLLNDSTLMRIGNARDTLLGVKSNSLIKAIVDSAMVTLASRLDSDINPRLQGNLSFVQKNASWLIVLTGAVFAAVGLIFWRAKERYLRIAKMLTFQISELKNTEVFEPLKENISKNAKQIGIEDQLRELLDENGILHLDKK